MIVWTEYLKYRAQLRGYELPQLEHIVMYSGERYLDTETGRIIAIGRHNAQLVTVAYGAEGDVITPVTVHAITRQQIRFRLQTERFKYE